jgi:very-short-patch-repair endonuclease
MGMRTHRHARTCAKAMRRPMTRSEAILWTRLQKRQAPGLHFRKQHPIGSCIADFACTKAKLVVEVDGATHSTTEERARDEQRRRFLEGEGWSILRVCNADVRENENGVLETIMEWARARPER